MMAITILVLLALVLIVGGFWMITGTDLLGVIFGVQVLNTGFELLGAVLAAVFKQD